jgi:small acid-soluble spore protein I (minor)
MIFLNIDIRSCIKDNFCEASKDEIKASIEASINENDDVTLPGIGVFFEILWNCSNDEEKDFILNKLEQFLKKED